jgi:hypothetical protein
VSGGNSLLVVAWLWGMSVIGPVREAWATPIAVSGLLRDRCGCAEILTTDEHESYYSYRLDRTRGHVAGEYVRVTGEMTSCQDSSCAGCFVLGCVAVDTIEAVPPESLGCGVLQEPNDDDVACPWIWRSPRWGRLWLMQGWDTFVDGDTVAVVGHVFWVSTNDLCGERVGDIIQATLLPCALPTPVTSTTWGRLKRTF